MGSRDDVNVKLNEANVDESRVSKSPPAKSTWKRRIDFLMNFFGMSIGLGNVWRFPYLCYKNGGGVFLIAYILLLAAFVVPVVILELAMGQYTRCSAVKIWKLLPIMRGVGYAGYVILLYYNIYYPVVLAWALRWLVAGFSSDLPWMNCNNTWNGKGCIPLIGDRFNNTQECYLNGTVTNSSASNVNGSTLSSVEEYWRKHIIGLSSGIEEIGEIKWELALCLLVIWIFVYFSIWKGISWTSKVVYFTATLPVVMMFIVLIRGVTLKGAATGIHEYLLPNMTKLADYEIWTDAANQVTYSFAIGYGCLATLSSHNKFGHNFLRDALLVSFANGLTSFISGFAIFSVLGHLALVKNTTISAVAESGPGLAFIAYPTALSLLPAPNLWMVLFFLTLILLGLDSVFVIQDGIFECTKDLAPWLFRHKWNHEIGHAILSAVMFILGLPLVTRGGMYIFHILNTYSTAGGCVFFVIFCETLTMGWMYDASRLYNKIQEMVNWRFPRLWLIVSWKIVSPVITLVLMFYSLYQFKGLTYDRTYNYPAWANAIAWMSTLSSVIFVPITAVYVIWKSEGTTLWQRVQTSVKSSTNVKNFQDVSAKEKDMLFTESDV